MSHSTILLFALLVLCTLSFIACENDRPIIAVLSQPAHSKEEDKHSYIAASYVKYLESSGARVVPLMYDAEPEDIKKTLLSVNGVLFPGGGTSLYKTKYLQVQKDILEFAMHLKDEHNVHFPVWATCLGFEAVVLITSGEEYDLMIDVDAWNISLPLNVTAQAYTSQIFSGMDDQLFTAIRNEPITMNNHHSGFRDIIFRTNKKLASYWKLLSVNFDRNGLQFASTIEAKNYPVYAVQWHPEKNSFEWTVREGIKHTAHAVRMTQYFSNMFIAEARKNDQTYNNIDEENAALIYNYNPEFTYLKGSDFQQCYFFKKSSKQ